MNYNKKDIITGLVVILLVIGGVYLFKYLKKDKIESQTPSPVSYEFQKDFEDSFKLDIPDDVNSIELKDVTGGDSRGIATENEILVDANDPESGFYQAWVEKDGTLTSLGKLTIAKGGWLIEYNLPNDMDGSKIVVSLENVNDDKIEKRILEGSF